MTRPYQIAAYYFPNFHLDPRNAVVHGPGWTEWELVKRATPRFPGHDQPRIPAWGYEDESDPHVMAKKIAAAADHNLDAFIFDWYWYNDGPYLERGLEQGFLHAPNNHRLKFAIMWANHNWVDIHPAKSYECQKQNMQLLYPGPVTRTTFETIVAHVIEEYFKHPSYWLIDGAPYVSIYDLASLVEGLGGVEAARDALKFFREKTKEAGFPDLHLNQVLWNNGILPGEVEIREPDSLLRLLRYDSFTSYVWVHHVPLIQFPQTSYQQAFEGYKQYWEKIESQVHLPYHPNVTVGWDPSPRTVQSDRFLNIGYPFTPVFDGNTPGAFRQALSEVKKRLGSGSGSKIVTINAWNEWTEGSYLEPDTRYGFQYLEAIRDVFGA